MLIIVNLAHNAGSSARLTSAVRLESPESEGSTRVS